MDPIRIAFDVGPLSGHRTGVGAAVAALADALNEHPDVELSPYVLSFRSRVGPPVRRLPIPAAAAHRLWSVADHPRLDRWLRGTDVVHGTNYVVPPTCRPTIVSVYDCWFLANPHLASPAVRRAGAVLRRRARAGATIHASSHATADAVQELLGSTRVEVVHLGPLPVPNESAHAAPWLSSLLDGVPFVLALGTMERRKNLPHLVEAFARAELADTVLVLAGADGDDSAQVADAVERLPRSVRPVRRLGLVDDDAKAWLLHHASVLAYPSLDEGFGFPILEAQAVGVPIVATRAGSIPEVAGAGAELVPLGDVDALAGALHRTVADEDRRRELVAAGRANVTRFSWSATAEAMVELYRKVAAR